jgi:hypothetical protein
MLIKVDVDGRRTTLPVTGGRGEISVLANALVLIGP